MSSRPKCSSKPSLKHSNTSINATLFTEISKPRTFCSIETNSSNLLTSVSVFNRSHLVLLTLFVELPPTWHLKSCPKRTMCPSTPISGVLECFYSSFCRATTPFEPNRKLSSSKKSEKGSSSTSTRTFPRKADMWYSDWSEWTHSSGCQPKTWTNLSGSGTWTTPAKATSGRPLRPTSLLIALEVINIILFTFLPSHYPYPLLHPTRPSLFGSRTSTTVSLGRLWLNGCVMIWEWVSFGCSLKFVIVILSFRPIVSSLGLTNYCAWRVSKTYYWAHYGCCNADYSAYSLLFWFISCSLVAWLHALNSRSYVYTNNYQPNPSNPPKISVTIHLNCSPSVLGWLLTWLF